MPPKLAFYDYISIYSSMQNYLEQAVMNVNIGNMRCKAFLTEQEIYIVPSILSTFPFLVVPVFQKCCESEIYLML
jgi:hypothetical protein